MSRARRLVALSLVLPLSLWPLAPASASPPQSEKRKDLMDQLGLPAKKKQPDEPKKDEGEHEGEQDPGGDAGEGGGTSEVETGPGDGGEAGSGGGGKSAKRRVTYTGRARKLLASGCESCHASGASAGSTRFVIGGSLDADYRSAKRLVNTSKPEASLLLTKAAGKEHGGGAPFPAGSSKYRTLLRWIEDGAPKGGGSASTTPAPAPTPAPTPTPEKSRGKSGGGKTGGGKTGGGKSGGREAQPTPPPVELGEAPEATEAPPEPSWVEPGAEERVGIPYAPRSHELLQAKCASCHAKGAMAGSTALVLTGDPVRDYAVVRPLVDPQNAEASPLLAKARGEAHGGGASLATSSADYGELLAWVEGGALGPTADELPLASGGASGGASGEAEAEGEGGESPEVDATTGASTRASEPGARLGDGTAVPESTGSRLPFSLPYHLRLNGRFDLSYERRDYKDHPFGEGRNALQTYHHFLFLSRSGAKDPFGFNIEVVTQQFFEFNARFETKNERAKFLIKAGKILVPFGNEPLFHTSYGGRTGFDQQLMPVIWSQPGLAFNAHVVAGPVTITSDTYAVQGYGLRSADGVLNLQSDVSTFESFQFGVGERVGLSWRPLTAWYSLQFNPLGFDRRLLMQALDVEFWRLQGVPFLQDLVVGLGLMRADVSGGGPGLDYYHFGSYGQVRYYPIDWLWIQYRWGLKTVDNRRGLYFDDTRMDERDASSHNLTIGATYMGFYAALQMFWNLEKANEQDNDFLRLTVGYAF